MVLILTVIHELQFVQYSFVCNKSKFELGHKNSSLYKQDKLHIDADLSMTLFVAA